jgi:ElaB/YqjD/DUF883 family membrane-anchored ribosome-binding protein
MSKQTQAIGDDFDQLAKDAGILIAATADMAEHHVGEARQRLAGILERGIGFYGSVKHRVAEGSKAADEIAHDHVYQAIGISIGAGVLCGFMLASWFGAGRCMCVRE